MSAAVRALEKAGAGFGDVRTEDRRAFVVRVANEQIQSDNEVHRRGWGIRAFVDGAWGYASGTSGRSTDAVQAARKAVAIARRGAAAGVPPSKLRKMLSTTITLEPKVRIEPRDVPGEEKVAAAMEVCRSEKREEVANTNASYADSDWTFELANTWGACLQWREVRIRIAGQAVAGEGDRRESAFDFRDGTAGWELVKALDLAAFGRGLAQEAVEMLGAAKPPAGLMPVVTDPGVSGLLAHEVMGHASEGDEIVKKRSFLTDQVGKKVGSALVSMYDDGTYPAAHGSIPFDAEGTPAHKTTVIDRGIYRGFLHSLETSGVLKARPTGNGRAQDFGRRVWVRMTNTYFGAGRDKKDEIVEETKSGVLTRKWISGMEDPVGGSFQAVTQSGFRIVRGEVGERVRGMTLTGDALSILKSVDRVSKEIALDGGPRGEGETGRVLGDAPRLTRGRPISRRRGDRRIETRPGGPGLLGPSLGGGEGRGARRLGRADRIDRHRRSPRGREDVHRCRPAVEGDVGPEGDRSGSGVHVPGRELERDRGEPSRHPRVRIPDREMRFEGEVRRGHPEGDEHVDPADRFRGARRHGRPPRVREPARPRLQGHARRGRRPRSVGPRRDLSHDGRQRRERRGRPQGTFPVGREGRCRCRLGRRHGARPATDAGRPRLRCGGRRRERDAGPDPPRGRATEGGLRRPQARGGTGRSCGQRPSARGRNGRRRVHASRGDGALEPRRRAGAEVPGGAARRSRFRRLRREVRGAGSEFPFRIVRDGGPQRDPDQERRARGPREGRATDGELLRRPEERRRRGAGPHAQPWLPDRSGLLVRPADGLRRIRARRPGLRKTSRPRIAKRT